VTYSVLARDDGTGQLGVAVQSHFFAVGRLVPWAAAGVGAVATQAFVEPGYGPRGLDLMRAGTAPQDALDRLVAADPGAAQRQVAFLDASGRAAAYTGDQCFAEAEHAAGPGVSAQGNMLRAPGTALAMVEAFGSARGSLARRLLAALEAAEACGGDARGRQAAALLVVGPDRAEHPAGGVLVDLRVDDAAEPLAELGRLLRLSEGYDPLAGVVLLPGIVSGAPRPSNPDTDVALAALDRAVRMLPGSTEPLLWRAVVLARAGRTEAARDAARVAVDRDPGLGPFLLRLQSQGVIPDATWVTSR
jgi:uncharacterized Ntn-hydrolase superfamily protein